MPITVKSLVTVRVSPFGPLYLLLLTCLLIYFIYLLSTLVLDVDHMLDTLVSAKNKLIKKRDIAYLLYAILYSFEIFSGFRAVGRNWVWHHLHKFNRDTLYPAPRLLTLTLNLKESEQCFHK